ncbi:CLUMA_CG020543, isoform A [Clunio marinus]|uniref:CLUMA_CG020543, isoform A n=1 Tax=Clunio marinus TaxID=568069 RepID=A0A1J1J6I4_9DIPT|nr:CLUMA_CG020543, isoform A [Clunio marinus]
MRTFLFNSMVSENTNGFLTQRERFLKNSVLIYGAVVEKRRSWREKNKIKSSSCAYYYPSMAIHLFDNPQNVQEMLWSLSDSKLNRLKSIERVVARHLLNGDAENTPDL